nr:unnamed protein product [Callosobruchus chinensis]
MRSACCKNIYTNPRPTFRNR